MGSSIAQPGSTSTMASSKLTISIPEDLRRRAKSVAALRNEHVSDVVRRALEDYVAEVMEEADDIRAIDEIEARMAAGKVRVRDWAEFEAEQDAMARPTVPARESGSPLRRASRASRSRTIG